MSNPVIHESYNKPTTVTIQLSQSFYTQNTLGLAQVQVVRDGKDLGRSALTSI